MTAKLLILIYHRVADMPFDPLRISISPVRFREHMDLLREIGHPVSLASGLEGLRTNNLPERSVAVTFDDGYADNLLIAGPILQSFDIPATLFVTVGPVLTGREFWWDELEHLLLDGQFSEEQLSVRVSGATIEGWVGKAGNDLTFTSWTVAETEAPTDAHRLFRELFRALRRAAPAERRRVLDEIAERLGRTPGVRPGHAPMTSTEVQEWNDIEAFSVGGHTVSHPILSLLPAEEQQVEITQGKKNLEAIVGDDVFSFAYPYGGEADLTSRTVQLVREAGFTSAFVNSDSIAHPERDALLTDRSFVGNWNVDQFEGHLSRLWTAGT